MTKRLVSLAEQQLGGRVTR
ncbi:hypothetical protein J4P91_23855 [Bacillus sp. XF8]|nr:hypothetical protein [Bacillus sp. XF8]